MQFLNYFKSVSCAPKGKSAPVAPGIATFFLFLISMFLDRAQGWLSYLAVFAFFSGILVFYCCYNSPNLEKSFPVNHNKKLLYRFLSSLFLFLIALITLYAITMFARFIVWITGQSSPQDYAEEVKATFSLMGVYGTLFGVAYFIILYSAGMLTGFIKRRKYRNIFLVCLCIALFLSDFFMGLPYYYSNSTREFIGPFLIDCYDAMALPWLAILFWFLIAAGTLGTAIYLGIKHYDPKKF